MKGGGVSLLMVLLLHMLFIGIVSAEGDSNGISSSNTSSHAVDLSDPKNAPDLVNGDGDKMDKHQDDSSQKEITVNTSKDTKKNSSEGKDKPLKEPKASGELSKEILDDGSNKDKPRTANTQAAGCDPSNRCIDKKTKLVACLRVPGTDAQALSLVIQNKGKGSLDVKIIAPSFVILELTNMQIHAKEDKEVKVSVNEDNTAKESMLILQAGGDNCSLDFRNIIPNSVSKSETLTVPRFLSTSSGFALVCILLAAAVFIGAAWLCFRFLKFLPQKSGPKYQKLEVGLPVSSGGKKEADDGDDNWDSSWGNGWDEEEAPMTPSKAISNPSLKGLASRRFNKDGWKD